MKNGLYRQQFDQATITTCCQRIRTPFYLIQDHQTLAVTVIDVESFPNFSAQYSADFAVTGFIPALFPERLGSQCFLQVHGARFPYIVGEMANGIATAQMVIAATKIGCLGFFGAAGLSPDNIEHHIASIQSSLGKQHINWGSNLIYSPHEPSLEEKITELYIHRNVHRVSASAYMQINRNLVYYACKGLYQDQTGQICRRNYLFAKISRPEIARQFMSPAPEELLNSLVSSKKLTDQEAMMAKKIPLAQDITVESDSGGHTDNRPLGPLFSAMQSLVKDIQEKYQYPACQAIRLGAAGGIGTPVAAAAAFGMGADYILTGSVNQSTVESGLSATGKTLLLAADIADITMAPAADMFELGVNLQVLKKGTLFPQRAKKLFQIYQQYASIEAIPESEKAWLEKNIFQLSLGQVWQNTANFFRERDPSQLEKSEKNPKHKMALLFRWYLGLSSRWAIAGDASRVADYQIWCGPALGAFNRWVAGSILDPLSHRTVAQVALNILEGAAVLTRAYQLRSFNVNLPVQAFSFSPRLFSVSV